jgi:hypothetical protein
VVAGAMGAAARRPPAGRTRCRGRPRGNDQVPGSAESYIVAAYLDGYSNRYELPRAYSSNLSYGYFEAPPDDHVALVRTVGEIGEDMDAYLLTGQREPWQRIWPRLRSLTVS